MLSRRRQWRRRRGGGPGRRSRVQLLPRGSIIASRAPAAPPRSGVSGGGGARLGGPRKLRADVRVVKGMHANARPAPAEASRCGLAATSAAALRVRSLLASTSCWL